MTVLPSWLKFIWKRKRGADTSRQCASKSNHRLTKSFLASLVLVSGAAFADADLVVNQTDSPDPGPAGGIFTYTIRTDNNGPGAATGVTFTDTLPSGSTFIGVNSTSGSCSESGGTVSCNYPDMPFTTPTTSITTTIQVQLPTAGVYTNNVSVNSTSTDNNPGNNLNVSESTTAVAAADLAMNATPSSTTVVAGQTFSYSLGITNNGPDAVESGGQIHISFSVPTGASITGTPTGSSWTCTPSSGYPLSTGTITCSAAALASGATSSTLNVNAVANTTGSIAADFAASATKSNGDPMPDGNSANNTASVSVTASSGSDVSITGSGSPTPIAQGGTVTYHLTPRFNGGIAPGSTGSGVITVTDTLGTGLTYVANSATGTGWSCSDAGQTVTCTRPGPYTGGNFTNMPQISLQAVATNAGTLVNNFSISIPETDPNTANNNGTVNITSSNEADLSISKTASLNPVVPGQDFNYYIRVRNNGLLAVASGQTITVTDNIPAGVTLTAQPTGGGWACTTTTGYPATGPVAVTCTRSGPLSAYSNAPTITLPVQLSAAATTTNTASVALSGAGPTDSNNTNNTSSVQVTASGTQANLSITKTASGTVDAGTDLTYTINVTNNGPDASTNVVMTDSLNSLIYTGGLQSITTTQGSCTPSGLPANGTSQNVSCNLGTLTSGATATVTIVVRPTIANTGTRSNTADVTSQDIGDPNRTNNTATVTSTVTAVADLVVSKSATPDPVPAGAPLTYTATIHNNGPSTAQTVDMTDTLPANATFIDLKNVSNGGSCSTVPNAGDAGGTLDCQWSSIPSGSQRTVTYRVRPQTSAIGKTVDNTVSATTTTKESSSANNSATTSTPVTATQLDVLINKSDSVDPVQLGSNTTYTITVTNNGPSLATGVVMTDTFPDPNSSPTAVFSYQGNLTVDQGGTCTEPAIGSTSGTITCSVPSLDQGQSATITYVEKAESLTQAGALSGTTYNAASVKVNETETTMANNQVTESTTASRSNVNADLSITKTLTKPTFGALFPGKQAVYQITATNNGPDTSQGAQVIDNLPQGLAFVSAPGCVLNGSSVLCNLGTLANGSSQSFTVTTTVNQPYDGNSPLVNTASVDAPGDPNTNNNQASVNSTVVISHGIPALSKWFALALIALLAGMGIVLYHRRSG